MRESLIFVIMSITLLRLYARHTDRRARTALVTLCFVIMHLLSSMRGAQPLLLPSGTQEYIDQRAVISSKYSAARDATIVIFYNLFVPHTREGVENAVGVVQDQMGQVSAALHRLEGPSGEKKGVVFYNLIGNEDGLPRGQMSALCHRLHPRLDCRRLRHYHNGTEAVTLTNLHEFCNSPIVADANRTRVVYLHSKGSYHDHGKQRPWRREMTNSSLDPHCLYPPDASCDVCGAQYYTMFASMFPGNMWTAKCSYIQKLLPPVEGGEYAKRREEAIKQFFLLKQEGIMQNTLPWHQDVFYGLDRYQWEHWVGGHPSLIPCEMHSPAKGFWDMVSGKVVPEDYKWGLARRDMVYEVPGKPKQWLSNNEQANFRQFYYLAGNMLKWIKLYNAVPSQESWVWDRFPAGQRWKELVAQRGVGALERMITSYSSRYYSPFASNPTATTASLSKGSGDELLDGPKPPIVVFYQITIPPDSKDEAMAAVKSQFDVLAMGQYDNITRTFDTDRKVLLHYITSGGSAQEIESVSNLCREKSDRIACRQLGTYDSDQAFGETLQSLYSFCTDRPSFKVVYISNQLLGDKTDVQYDAKAIEMSTSVVISNLCQPDGDTCNVCGAEFYPLPFLHFTGNAFAASCDYVKGLLSPRTFEKESYNVAGDSLVAHLRTQFTTELLKFNPRILGLKQHSVEHWIGSHPDLRPCDAAPMDAAKPDGPLLERMKQHSWSLAPRRGSAPAGYFDSETESKFRKNREAAFREYYYLAGNVFRWDRLYKKVPSPSSWVWKWFPDGDAWEVAARKSGADAVKKIAKHLDTNIGMEQFWVE
ncbi:hypothetical protein ACHAXT_003492 [Thalassiosira profunda]